MPITESSPGTRRNDQAPVSSMRWAVLGIFSRMSSYVQTRIMSSWYSSSMLACSTAQNSGMRPVASCAATASVLLQSRRSGQMNVVLNRSVISWR